MLSYLLALLIFQPGWSSSMIFHSIAYSPSPVLETSPVWETANAEFVSENVAPDDIRFLNATHGWILSQRPYGLRNGMILHSDDGGVTWSIQLQNISQRYRVLAIIDEDSIWATCLGGVCHTQDGGTTWNYTWIGNPEYLFYGLCFINRTHGWASSNEEILYRTVDAGVTWQAIDFSSFNDWARRIYFLSDLEGWAIGFSGIYHTTDGGITWVRSFDHGGWNLSFVDEEIAWAVADDWLARMNDGVHWVYQPLPRKSPFPPHLGPYWTDILFLDSQNGWIAGDETEIAYTPNGGQDWYSQEFPDDTRVMAIDFVNLTHGWAVGWGGHIYRTIHGDSLGPRLWLGLADPLILTAVSIPAGLVLLVLVFLAQRRVRRWKKRTEVQPTVELRY